MKKLKNIHPLKEIVVQGQAIMLVFMLTISRIGAAYPISFVSAIIEVPRPFIVFEGNPSSRKRFGATGYRGKIRRRKNFSKKYGKEV